jgi:hypothetical protein
MRRGPAAALAILAAVVGFLLGRLWDDEAPADVAPLDPGRRSADAEAASLAAAPSVSEALSEAPSETADDALPRGSAQAQARAPAASAPDAEVPNPGEFPSLEVRVHGDPGAVADVYALPAGSPGRDDEQEVARQAVASPGGAYLLRVPRAGRYDVGARGTSGEAVLEHDVRIPEARPLVLRLPAVADVVIEPDPALARRLEATAPAWRPGDEVDVHLSPVAETPLRAYPGRGEAAAHSIRSSFGLPVRALVLRAAAGRPYALRVSSRDRTYAVEPETVVPPARVTIRDRVLLRVRPEFRTPPDLAVPTGVGLAFSVGGREVGRHAWAVGPGLTDPPNEYSLHVDVSAATLEWRGDHVAAGSTRFAADDRGEARLTVPVEITSVPTSVAVGTGTEVRRVVWARVVVESGGDRPTVEPTFVAPGDDVRSRFDWDAERGEGEATLRRGAPEWALAYAQPAWVTEAVRRPRTGTVLTLRRGGWVVVVPDRVVADGLSLSVRRADGAPLLRSAEGQVEGYEGSTSAHPGTVLGPFPPGPVSLVYSIAGVDVSTDVVTVRAGGYVPSNVRPGDGG